MVVVEAAIRVVGVLPRDAGLKIDDTEATSGAKPADCGKGKTAHAVNGAHVVNGTLVVNKAHVGVGARETAGVCCISVSAKGEAAPVEIDSPSKKLFKSGPPKPTPANNIPCGFSMSSCDGRTRADETDFFIGPVEVVTAEVAATESVTRLLDGLMMDA